MADWKMFVEVKVKDITTKMEYDKVMRKIEALLEKETE